MTEAKEHVLSPAGEAQRKYSQLCHDAGQLMDLIKQMQGDLEDILVKVRNAKIDYKRAKDAETPKEATNLEGVTQ